MKEWTTFSYCAPSVIREQHQPSLVLIKRYLLNSLAYTPGIAVAVAVADASGEVMGSSGRLKILDRDHGAIEPIAVGEWVFLPGVGFRGAFTSERSVRDAIALFLGPGDLFMGGGIGPVVGHVPYTVDMTWGDV